MSKLVLKRSILITGLFFSVLLIFNSVLIATLANSTESVTAPHQIHIPVQSLQQNHFSEARSFFNVHYINDKQTLYFLVSKDESEFVIVPANIAIISTLLDPVFLLLTLFFTAGSIYLHRLFNHEEQTIEHEDKITETLNHFFLSQGITKNQTLSSPIENKYCDDLEQLLLKSTERFSQLQFQSTYLHHQDKLTLLIDRHAFLKHLSRKLMLAERSKSKCALLFIDLDGFKQVNDSFGHSYGDEVLISVAKRLNEITRRHEISDLITVNDNEVDYCLSRLGGDEFSIFIDEFDNQDKCVQIAQDVLNAIETDFDIGNKIIKISASVGIATYPDSAATPQSLLQMADVAMYRAKTDGRGIFKIYSPEMSSKLRRYHYLVEELRLALASHNFFLTFQPIVHVGDCTIDYFEALVRWHHPVEGYITPSEFIPIAEETNIILELGDWIMYEACAQMSAWYYAGMKKVKMSVNVSGVQLRHRKLYSWVSDILAKTKLPASSLMLEITETTLIKASSHIIEELEQCRAAGIIIAIDDFGTGFSSLSTLADLPIDVIKIDKQFISSAHDSIKYFKILQSISELGKDLGLKLVAEGVERTEQFELVKQLGISCVQGYLVSQPQSSTRVNNKVLKANVNNVALTGTSVWLPE
ncbi:putative bifunctional diguanylate cyclase/phosphodiesterase [Pseudoalteromonas xiamenensis]|uniref:putative bifunctional diguanylate cyclase/phosphodiesterase n=1 Tax=Pseudoalteromonas xiamenensis TaxID=882626 RepID=UPI0035ED06F8